MAGHEGDRAARAATRGAAATTKIIIGNLNDALRIGGGFLTVVRCLLGACDWARRLRPLTKKKKDSDSPHRAESKFVPGCAPSIQEGKPMALISYLIPPNEAVVPRQQSEDLRPSRG